MRRLALIAPLLLAGCGWFARPPTPAEIYDSIRMRPEQPFNVEALACEAAGADGWTCRFDATIVSGYSPGFVGDTRPDYRRVRMSGFFRRAGVGWRAEDVTVGGD